MAVRLCTSILFLLQRKDGWLAASLFSNLC